MPRYYPMMMDLQGRRCLVIGGGDVAARKIEMLASCGAKVLVVAPEAEPSIQEMAANGTVTHIASGYESAHMEGVSLLIAATDDNEVNRKAYEDATGRGIPANVVDVPELCSFIVPSVIERGDLLLAISTSGKSPAFSRRVRLELEEKFGPEYGKMLTLMGEIRELVKEKEPDLDIRMATLKKIANSDLLDRIKSGEAVTAEQALKEYKA